MEIRVQADAVTIGQAVWAESPDIGSVAKEFANFPYKVVEVAERLSRLVYDDVGLAVRFSPSSKKAHSLLIFFAVSPRDDQPKTPFAGSVILGEQRLIRPALTQTISGKPAFHFDKRPEPVALG